MRYLLPLYFKEIKGEQDSIIGYMAIIVVFMLIMLVLAIWRPESWIIGMIQLPIGLLPVWFVYASLEIISREWREKSIALLSGIPVKPLYLLGAKMGADFRNKGRNRGKRGGRFNAYRCACSSGLKSFI